MHSLTLPLNSPIHVTIFQTQSREERRYKHTLDAALTIYRNEGWRAFFRGLFPSLLGITHVAVQFPLYEYLKGWASKHRALAWFLVDSDVLVALLGGGAPEKLSAQQILGCSSAAKMTASIATYPHEVLRTRLQTFRRAKEASVDTHGRVPGIIGMAKQIVRNEGWSALYRGLSVNLVRTVPNSAVTMLTCVDLPIPPVIVVVSADHSGQIRDVNAVPQCADRPRFMTLLTWHIIDQSHGHPYYILSFKMLSRPQELFRHCIDTACFFSR